MKARENILNYISLHTLEIILDTYINDFPDICLAINDLDENIIVARNFHPICANFNRQNPGTEKLCKECNMYITQHLHENNYIEHKCGNGLVDIAFPLRFEDKHIGTFYIGQVFIAGDETPMDFFENHAQTHNLDKDGYIAAAKTIKTLTRQQIDELVEKVKNDILDVLTV